jgi:hypothetical protein
LTGKQTAATNLGRTALLRRRLFNPLRNTTQVERGRGCDKTPRQVARSHHEKSRGRGSASMLTRSPTLKREITRVQQRENGSERTSTNLRACRETSRRESRDTTDPTQQITQHDRREKAETRPTQHNRPTQHDTMDPTSRRETRLTQHNKNPTVSERANTKNNSDKASEYPPQVVICLFKTT